jgi:hypothetical protein
MNKINLKNMNQKYFRILILSLVALNLFAVSSVSAQTNNNGTGKGMMRGVVRNQLGVFGKITAINGNTVTVTDIRNSVVYTIDATNAKIIKNNVTGSISSIAVGDVISVQGTITGTNVVATTIREGSSMMGEQKNVTGINGTVTVINGNTITVVIKTRSAKNGSTANTASPIIYSVDASSATITKNGAVGTIASISVGDNVTVQGTVTGTNIVAKVIRDGLGQGLQEIQGNGEPVVAGKITAINGNIITITNNSNINYTIDAKNAKFSVKGISIPKISDIAVGDGIVVQGTINGNSVVASLVIDQKISTNSSVGNSQGKAGFMGNMMNKIGGFFKHLFGF